MRILLALAFFAAVASGAPVPKEAKLTPLDKIQGKWIIVSLDRGEGPIVPDGDFATYTLTIDGVTISTATASATAYPKVRAKFDLKSDPMTMTMPFGGDKVIPGIIKLEGDKLHWCHAQAGKERPTEFRGGNGDQYFIWKRPGK